MRIPPQLVWTSLLLAVLPLSACGPVHEETITDFRVEAEIHQDGTLTMSESITYDFGPEPSAGLLWELPLTVPESFLRHRAVELTDLDVASPSGAPAEIEGRSESHGWISLEIGDEDDPVTGEQTYVVSYTLSGALTTEDGVDELYWDFIGTGWGVHIDNADVQVTAPEIGDVHCYAGEEDDDSPCETVIREGETVRFAEDGLAEGAGITAIVELPSGTVEIPEADYVLRPLPRWLTWSGVASLVAALAATSGVLYLVYKVDELRKARGRKRFPKELPRLSPAAAGLFYRKERLKTEHLLAMLVSLEDRGVITSEPHPKRNNDWLFRLFAQHGSAAPRADKGVAVRVLRPSARYGPGVSRAEGRLLSALFQAGSDGDLTRLRSAMSRSDARKIRRELTREVTAAGLLQPVWLRGPAALLIFVMLVGTLVVPIAIRDLTPFNPTGLETFSIVLVALAVVIGIGTSIPFHHTRYGEHARLLLGKARKTPGKLDAALAVALGLRQNMLARVPDIADRIYLNDEDYLRRWEKSLNPAVRSANSSGSSGGGSVGGGGGGSRGGSR